MKIGICYYITADYLPFALASLRSFRKFYPDMPAEIFSFQELPHIDEPSVQTVKVAQPIVLESIKATVIRIKHLVHLNTDFDLFILSDVDMFYNTNIDELIEKAKDGFICANQLSIQISYSLLEPHLTRYNTGFIVAMTEIKNQYFGGIYKWWNEEKTQVWSDMWIFNTWIHWQQKSKGIIIPMYDIPEKYLWLIENYPIPKTLEGKNYHLAFGNSLLDDPAYKEHPAIKEYLKLLK